MKKIENNWNKLKYFCWDKYKKINSFNIDLLINSLLNEKKIKIFICGKKYEKKKNMIKTEKDIDDMKSFFNKMKKFTYTNRFFYENRILNELGWSCTIRSGQMLLINFLIKKNSYEKNLKIDDILEIFLNQNLFSISNILKRGKKNFSKKIGTQWSQKEVFETCSKILSEYNEKKNEKFLKGLKNLEIINSNGYLIKDKIEETLKNNKEILLIINLRLGKNRIDLKKKAIFLKLVESKFFTGMVGGEDKSAYYIFGLFKDNLLYLDPHKIRKGEKYSNYSISDFNGIKYNNLHPSISVGFHLKNIDCYLNFQNFIKKLNSEILVFVSEEEFDQVSLVEIDINNADNIVKNKNSLISSQTSSKPSEMSFHVLDLSETENSKNNINIGNKIKSSINLNYPKKNHLLKFNHKRCSINKKKFISFNLLDHKIKEKKKFSEKEISHSKKNIYLSIFGPDKQY